MALQEQRHKVRDISVRLARNGKGEPLMFLHGAAGYPGWTPFFEKLATRCELLVPEHPGFGLSDNPPWIRNVADLAMYYLDFLDTLPFARVHIIGHSLGGWTAAEMAVRNCGKLTSLTLIAPAGVRVKGMPCGDNFIWSPEEAARNSYFDQALAERDLARNLSEEEADIALTNRFAAVKFGWEPRWLNPALERWLHRISVRTLLIWGRDDKLFPVAYAKAWQAAIPDARVEIISQCGHRPPIEKADLTAEKILDFVDGGRR